MKQWANLASEAIPNYYATEINVPTVFVNQGGYTITPCQTPRFYPLPPLKDMRYEFCGKSSIRDASGKILVQANVKEVDYHGVGSVKVNPAINYPKPKRSDIPNQYLRSDYYVVQPPLIAKTFQTYFTYGFQRVYESRRRRYL
jgi:predicted amidohydrolase